MAFDTALYYTYNADAHCPDCARADHGTNLDERMELGPVDGGGQTFVNVVFEIQEHPDSAVVCSGCLIRLVDRDPHLENSVRDEFEELIDEQGIEVYDNPGEDSRYRPGDSNYYQPGWYWRVRSTGERSLRPYQSYDVALEAAATRFTPNK